MAAQEPYTQVERDALMERIAGMMSGWNGGFHTRSNNNTVPEKPIPISASEILDQIKLIKELCNKANIDRYQQLLVSHITDTNNPHNTDLSQFHTGILELLYDEYTNRGGTATYEAFLNILFQAYQVAGTADVWDGTDERLLVSVRVAYKFIQDHNDSIEAHAPLFAKLMPGIPVDIDPSWAIMSYYDLPLDHQTNRISAYNYIGPDGYMYAVSDIYNALPQDYTYGQALWPCFGPRTNYCKQSTDLTDTSVWDTDHLTINTSTTWQLDKTKPTCLITESADTAPVEHILSLKQMSVQADTPYSVSIYGHCLKAKLFLIRFKDQSLGLTRFIYANIETGKTIVDNANADIYAEVESLASGFFRLGICFKNKYDTVLDIQFIPYKLAADTPTYAGSGEALCYLFGAQFEQGIGWSPLIHTEGEIVTRTGGQIEVPLSTWYNQSEGTLVVEASRTIPLAFSQSRTLYSIRNETSVAMRGLYRDNNIFFTEMYDPNDTQIWDYPIAADHSFIRKVAFAYGSPNIYVAVSGNTAKGIPLIAVRRFDATTLCLGHDQGQNFYEGYIKASIYYPEQLSLDNLTFLAGD